MRVLVVEDEELVRAGAAEALRAAGFHVDAAGTGEAATAFLESAASVDVLITDIRLPGEIDGWRVAELFRSSRPDLSVVYVSAYSMDYKPEAGGVFLQKPYSFAALVSIVEGKAAAARARNRVSVGKG